jgi:hypothetical protein
MTTSNHSTAVWCGLGALGVAAAAGGLYAANRSSGSSSSAAAEHGATNLARHLGGGKAALGLGVIGTGLAYAASHSDTFKRLAKAGCEYLGVSSGKAAEEAARQGGSGLAKGLGLTGLAAATAGGIHYGTRYFGEEASKLSGWARHKKAGELVQDDYKGVGGYFSKKKTEEPKKEEPKEEPKKEEPKASPSRMSKVTNFVGGVFNDAPGDRSAMNVTGRLYDWAWGVGSKSS